MSTFHKLTCLATALARSLQVSVLPVPAGPSGAPPRLSSKAPINVLKQEIIITTLLYVPYTITMDFYSVTGDNAFSGLCIMTVEWPATICWSVSFTEEGS